jgi:hypothetical protein
MGMFNKISRIHKLRVQINVDQSVHLHARRGDVEDIRETCLNGTLFGSLKKKCNQQVSKFDILFNFIIKQEKYFCQIQQYIEEKLD